MELRASESVSIESSTAFEHVYMSRRRLAQVGKAGRDGCEAAGVSRGSWAKRGGPNNGICDEKNNVEGCWDGGDCCARAWANIISIAGACACMLSCTHTISIMMPYTHVGRGSSMLRYTAVYCYRAARGSRTPPPSSRARTRASAPMIMSLSSPAACPRAPSQASSCWQLNGARLPGLHGVVLC